MQSAKRTVQINVKMSGEDFDSQKSRRRPLAWGNNQQFRDHFGIGEDGRKRCVATQKPQEADLSESLKAGPPKRTKMGRIMPKAFETFKEEIWRLARQRGMSVMRWFPPRSHKSTENLRQLDGPSGRRLLYIKESDGHGFWGVNANHVDALNESGEKWLLVLLESADSGYMLPAVEVNSAIKSWSFQASKGECKVHQHELSHRFAFRTLDELLSHA
jgi:hypothetical protein